MKRSVYSLVLMDEVVNEVDRLAGDMNTSRSNLINSILADYVSLVTPEQHMHNIFGELERMIRTAEHLQLCNGSSDCIRILKSSLSYKYRPAIKYHVEFFRSKQPAGGLLRVVLRTQSKELLDALDYFFKAWSELEQRYNLPYTNYKIEPGRYSREFALKGMNAGYESNAAQALLEYIEAFDYALKHYFKALESGNDPEAEISKVFMTYRSSRRFEI